MTDFANEMSGLSKQARRLRHSKNEYRVYLALIFLAALPFCTVIWAYRLIRRMTLPTLGPIHSCLLSTSPSPRDGLLSRMPSSA